MKDSTGDDIERELIDAYNSRVSPSRQAQRVDAEARIDTLQREVALIRQEEELPQDTCDRLHAASNALRHGVMLPGGGGTNSVRSSLSKLITLHERASKEPQSFRWPAQGVPAGVAMVLYDFTKEARGEISVRAGDMVTLIDRPAPDGWLYASNAREVGLVPEAYVEVRYRWEAVRSHRSEEAPERGVHAEQPLGAGSATRTGRPQTAALEAPKAVRETPMKLWRL